MPDNEETNQQTQESGSNEEPVINPDWLFVASLK